MPDRIWFRMKTEPKGNAEVAYSRVDLNSLSVFMSTDKSLTSIWISVASYALVWFPVVSPPFLFFSHITSRNRQFVSVEYWSVEQKDAITARHTSVVKIYLPTVARKLFWKKKVFLDAQDIAYELKVNLLGKRGDSNGRMSFTTVIKTFISRYTKVGTAPGSH